MNVSNTMSHATGKLRSPGSRRGWRPPGAWWLVLACCLALGIPTQAQAPINDLIFTVGTTARTPAAQDWSYVFVGSVDSTILRGKRFAIYGKAGAASSPALFSLRGNLFQQTDPTAINTLLNQSVSLGQDLTALSQTLDGALRRVPGITTQPLAQKVLTLFQIASTNESMANIQRMMALHHPAVKMALGQAFAEQIVGVTTYEVREVDPISAQAGDVMGRVSITPGAPVVLPAPGAPYQVLTNHPNDHLTIRLRWGTPDALRRLSLMNYGFNVWRMPRSQAEAAGFHVTPPTVAQLAANPNFYRANEAPATVTKEFSAGSGAGAADDPADRLTYFFSDNNHASRSGAVAFLDGEEFYYFVTARDLLGRDGLVSPGRLARACRRIAPIAPTDPAIRNEPKVTSLGAGLTTNEQRFRILWKQNTNAAELVTHYWIYRWPNPTMTFTNDGLPLNYRVGVVSHDPGTNQNTFLDDFAGSPKTPGLSNYWYTVRAVSMAACDPLLSPHSPPVSGVLRQREGPEATVGTVIGSCGTAAVIFTNLLSDAVVNFETGRLYFRFVCDRRDPGIAWVRFYITNGTESTQSMGPIYFPGDGNRVEQDYTPREDAFFNTDVTCVVGSAYGSVSRSATYRFVNPPARGQRLTVRFLAGQILLTAASTFDPLLRAVNAGYGNGTTFCVPAVNPTPDASGTVTMGFDLPARPPVMVQSSSNGGPWLDVAIAVSDTNGVYAISYPACLYGPLPALRGCVVNLPADADCSQHVARGADEGGVAPIDIRFRLTKRTREYRLYRQVNDGVLTLLSQGAAKFDPAKPSFELVRKDDAMPVSPARLCYYVQLLDEHGNPSPMALIGCKDVKPPQLPMPILAEPNAAGTVAAPQVALNWFCPTGGVYRFAILVHRLDDPENTKPIAFEGVQILKGGSITLGSVFASANALQPIRFSEEYFTAPVGPGFGPGPQFAMNIRVSPSVPYRISVRAVDAQGSNGPISAAWEFTWHPPLPVEVVQWPFRSLPAVAAFHPAIRTRLMSNYVNQSRVLNQDFPVGVRIGAIPDGSVRANSDERTLAVIGLPPDEAPINPHRYLFRRNASVTAPPPGTDVILPVALYRVQVTNATFPKVSGDVTQVSPLIEKLATRRETYFDYIQYRVVDRLIGRSADLEFEMPGELANSNDGYTGIYLFDSQPVISGATYRYYLVRFKDDHEVDQIIPAGDVTIP